MQKGADPWQAAGYLGMSLEVLLNTYGHHHPDYLSDAVEKIAMREAADERKPHVSGAVSGAVIPLRRFCRALGDGLWEVRTSLRSNRIARVLFSVQRGRILVLHGFIKKTQKAPPDDLALARRRNREFEK